MKDRPILFSAPMVCAILDGKKTQTRRVIIPQPYRVDSVKQKSFSPGDHLWVRETFKIIDPRIIYAADVPKSKADEVDHAFGPWKPSIFMPRWASRITLEITDVRVERLQTIDVDDCAHEGLQSTEFMPKLQHKPLEGYIHADDHEPVRMGFKALWDSINGRRKGCSWSENPWVFVISLRKLEPLTGLGV